MKNKAIPAYAKSELKKIYHRVRRSPKIIFLDWYCWVDFDLFGYCKSRFKYDCDISRLSKEELMSSFGVNLSINSSLDDAVSLSSFLKENVAVDYREISYRGLYLWEICKSSIFDHLLKTSINLEEDKSVIDFYYRSAAQLIDALVSFFEHIKPNVILVVQGFQYDMRAAVEVSRWFGCKAIAIENSFLRDYFFIDAASGGICNRHFLARNAWDIIQATVLTEEESYQLAQFISTYSTTIARSQPESTVSLRKRIPGSEGKKIALLLGQVATDAAVIMDSPIYPDIVDFILDTAYLMATYKEEYHLVVRLHPKEAYGVNHHDVPFNNRTLQRLQQKNIHELDHVTLFHSDQVDTYQLMDIAEIGFVLTSQSGLEFLARHKPTIVLGDAFYRGKGFTFDVSHVESFPAVIEKAIASNGLSNRQKASIDKFLHYMIFNYLFPKEIRKSEARIRNILQLSN